MNWEQIVVPCSTTEDKSQHTNTMSTLILEKFFHECEDKSCFLWYSIISFVNEHYRCEWLTLLLRRDVFQNNVSHCVWLQTQRSFIGACFWHAHQNWENLDIFGFSQMGINHWLYRAPSTFGTFSYYLFCTQVLIHMVCRHLEFCEKQVLSFTCLLY